MTTTFDASSELTMNVALFACGALGYFATRWANRRIFQPRFPPKKVFVEDEEEARFSTSIVPQKSTTCVEAHEPESEPTVAAVVTSSASARRARRRSARQAKVTEAAAEPPATASLLHDEQQEEPAFAFDEAIAVDEADEAAEAEEAEEGEDLDVEACPLADDVPIFDVSLPQPVAALDEEEYEDTADAEEALEVEPAVSDRVARLLAKKAARKQRKAEERQQLAEQLAAALAKSCAIVHEEVQEPADEVDEEVAALEPETEHSDLSQSGDLAQAAEAEEHDEVVETAQLEEVQAAVEAKAKEAADEEAADEVETDAEASDKEEVAEELQADNSDKLQAFGLSQVMYTPILSPDGQQLYTDGQQVYIMACVQLPDDAAPATDSSQEVDPVAVAAASAASMEAPESVIHAITDPSSPWHRVAMDLGVTSPAEEALLLPSPPLAPMPAPPVPAFAMEPNPDMDVIGFPPAPPLCTGFAPPAAAACGGAWCPAPEEECEEHNLWDVCWEFVV